MATIIDELMITLGIDGSDAKKGMSEVTGAIQGGVSKITGMLGGLTAAFAGVFAVGSAFSDYLNSADAMAKFSRSIGANIEDVHAWSEAVIRSGGSAEGFQGSVKGLTTQLSKMATLGKSKAGNVLAAVGIDPGEVGRQRDAFDVLMDISDKMQTMSAAEATGFGQSLGLDVGTINLLREGRDGVKDLIRHQKELGVYDEATAKAAEDFNDAMADTKQAFTVLVATIGSAVLPALKTFLQYVSRFVAFLRQNQDTVKIFFTMIAALITTLLIPTIMRLFAAILTNPITWLLGALVLLAIALEDLWGWMNGKDAEFAELWAKLFGSPKEAKAKFEEYKTKFFEFTDEVAKKASELMKWMGENFDFVAIAAAFTVFAGIVKTVVIPVFSAIAGAVKSVIGIVQKVPGFFARMAGKVRNAIGIIRAAIWAIKLVFQGLFAVMKANPIILAITTVITVLQDLYQWVTTGESMFEELWAAIFGDPEHAKEIFNDVCQFLENTWNAAIKFVKDKWDWLKNAASSACDTIKGAIQSVADFIRSAIGSAIDWAIQKWEALKATVSGGVTFSQDNMSYLGWGSGGSTSNTTNNNSSSTNYNIGTVNVNGAKNPNATWRSFVPQTNSG